MDNRDDRYSIFTAIVNRGKASKMLKDAKRLGVSGGSIVYGYGTAKDELLHFLELYEIEKEILFMVIENKSEAILHEKLSKKYNLEKENRGIAFSSPITGLAGVKSFIPNKKIREDGRNTMEHEAIFVVVDKHRGEEVIESAEKYGSKGATIIPGRGSGIHEKGTIFNLIIEPEKDIILMVVESENTNKIIDGIKKDLKIDEPGEGIIFAVGITRATGLIK